MIPLCIYVNMTHDIMYTAHIHSWIPAEIYVLAWETAFGQNTHLKDLRI